ncbi:FecCD family ABC transporter permease [Larsenimonas rhizosphaerae]|uniref:FecCD family ABC transporter permease n=1 Tax=Larsenimonas rhizosphaerae TaxID=2944682 RepID=UPI002034393B|nr:iron ABC transporter permease [Larsenimonas rhizosphaerae]MCM2131927.1 iron ABC transporter permease [Larsenimonas rhizosphaerae]
MAERDLTRTPGFSRQWCREGSGRVGLALLVVVSVVLVSLSLGKVVLTPAALWAAWGAPSTPAGMIVTELRLPRIVLAALVGGALGLSGWLLQQVMRNPLASPDIIGVTSGASAAAVGYMALLGAGSGMQWLPVAAVAGAIATALGIYRLAWQGGVTPIRLVLMGIGASATLGALTMLALVLSPLTTTLSAYVWLTGSVYGAHWGTVRTLAGCCALLLMVLVPLMRHVPLAPLNDALATGLGVRVQRLRAMVLALAATLAGVAIAWGGAFAFVGLVAPHLARLVCRRPGLSQGVLAVLIGSTLVMLADLLGRTLFLPLDLPAGIFVAAIGAPFFLGLLLREVR